MEMRQLRHFVEVYRSGSFVQAAASCFMTAQGIGSSITRLESELGFKLFVRSQNGLTLTKQGEFLLPRAEKILDTLDECGRFFEHEKKNQCIVTAMFVRGTMEDIVYPCITKFRSIYPDYSLRVNVGSDLDCESAVLNGEADLALCAGPISHRRLEGVLLYSDKNVLVVNRNHPLARQSSVSVPELRGIPLAAESEATRSTATLLRLCREQGFDPTVETYVNEPRLAAYLAHIGQCCGIMSMASAVKECAENVCILPFDEAEMDWSVYLIKAKGVIISPIVREFEKLLRQQCMEY